MVSWEVSSEHGVSYNNVLGVGGSEVDEPPEHFHLIKLCMCVCTRLQLWCAAGVDLTGWRAGSQEPAKALSGGSDPLNAEEDRAGKKSSHSSPEKRKVRRVRATDSRSERSHAVDVDV